MRKIVVFIYAFLFALQSSLFSKENDVMSYLAEYDSLFQAVENDLRKNKRDENYAAGSLHRKTGKRIS